MNSEKIVVSLGGNALGYEPSEQLENVKKAAKIIAELAKEGHQLLICHGNGPQVGLIDLAFETGDVPKMPFAECGAMSQGYIGYHLQQCIRNELMKEGIEKDCVSLLTQVVVDENDKAFCDPSKPIGPFLTYEEAKERSERDGFIYKEDSGRGYRRVVASPLPIDIVEKDSIGRLLKDSIVICCGGGGIPVIRKETGYEGISAVIDKDRSSALLGKLLDGDKLLILTAVDHAYIDFGKPEQKKLERVDVETMKGYLKEGYFAKGSMYPKVEACLDFVEKGKEAIITSLDQALPALNGQTGTCIWSGQ